VPREPGSWNVVVRGRCAGASRASLRSAPPRVRSSPASTMPCVVPMWRGRTTTGSSWPARLGSLRFSSGAAESTRRSAALPKRLPGSRLRLPTGSPCANTTRPLARSRRSPCNACRLGWPSIRCPIVFRWGRGPAPCARRSTCWRTRWPTSGSDASTEHAPIRSDTSPEPGLRDKMSRGPHFVCRLDMAAPRPTPRHPESRHASVLARALR